MRDSAFFIGVVCVSSGYAFRTTGSNIFLFNVNTTLQFVMPSPAQENFTLTRLSWWSVVMVSALASINEVIYVGPG